MEMHGFDPIIHNLEDEVTRLADFILQCKVGHDQREIRYIEARRQRIRKAIRNLKAVEK